MVELPNLHLEITSKCALSCPACPRTYHAGDFKVADLPMTAIENILSSKQRFSPLILCGDHGDPIYHSRFHEILALLLQVPHEPFIYIATNGSHRSREWWEKTGSLLRAKDRVVFGIDGLADTAKNYRRGSDWDSISTAIQTLKAVSQVQIHWQWILFSYNEHQLVAAAKQARAWRVDRFTIVGSSRHDSIDPWKPERSLEQATVEFQRAYDDLSTM